MRRLRRFETLEKARPTGSDGPARGSGLADRFGLADSATVITGELPARSQGTAERFGTEPASDATLRLREPDEGQPFVRCSRCRADGHVSSVVCSHCGADLTTREQRDYNEALWRQRQVEQAEQRDQLAKMEVARAQAEREAAEARRQLDELIRQRRSTSGQTVGGAEDTLRTTARSLGDKLGAWLRRAFPNRTHRLAVAALVAVALVGLVAAFPIEALRVFWGLAIVAAAYGWYRRLGRFWRE